MITKICGRCKKSKNTDEFGKSKSEKDGFARTCKDCRREEYQNNKDHKMEYQKKYYENNKEKRAEYYKQWRTDNKEYKSQMDKEYVKNHREELNKKALEKRRNNPDDLYCQTRKSIYKTTTPKWADKMRIKAYYEAAKIMTKRTGIRYTVDHIIPFKGKSKKTGEQIICGLHVENNLQIITLQENVSKGCFVDLDELNGFCVEPNRIDIETNGIDAESNSFDVEDNNNSNSDIV